MVGSGAFRFQQFSVAQRRSAMKVCTDASLFGAMMPLRGGEHVLDIGTGTGLLALMAAQLGAATVSAVELDDAACAEAAENFSASPWASCLQAISSDIQGYAATVQDGFDLVISNPPFFVQHSKAADENRKVARHTDTLSFSELITAVDLVLSDDGLFYVMIPCHAISGFEDRARQSGLYLQRLTEYRANADRPAKVAALTFGRMAGRREQQTLTIYSSPRIYTRESADYLAPFLLRFANN